MEDKIIINKEITEIYNDWFNADSMFKKDLCNKYGIQSNKINEIKHLLLEKANNLRREINDTSHWAYVLWNYYWDVPSSSQKLKIALEGESKEFIDLLLKETEKPKWRGDNRHKLINKIVEENNKKNNNDLLLMIDLLNEKTIDFKEKYINSIVDYECKSFNYFLKYKDLNAHYNYFKKEVEVSSNYNGEIPENLSEKWLRRFNFFKMYSENFNREVFVNKTWKEAEEDFNNNIKSLAEKLYNNDISVDFDLNYISNDPKLFECYISDNDKSFHARSIFCAEYSIYVSPHWRFIVTKTK